MGLETPQGREIFTKGIVVVSPALSAPSAMHGAGTKPSDPLRVFPLCCWSLGLQRAGTDLLQPPALGILVMGASRSTGALKAWQCCSVWYEGQRLSDFLIFFNFFFFLRDEPLLSLTFQSNLELPESGSS